MGRDGDSMTTSQLADRAPTQPRGAAPLGAVEGAAPGAQHPRTALAEQVPPSVAVATTTSERCAEIHPAQSPHSLLAVTVPKTSTVNNVAAASGTSFDDIDEHAADCSGHGCDIVERYRHPTDPSLTLALLNCGCVHSINRDGVFVDDEVMDAFYLDHNPMRRVMRAGRR